MRVAATARSIGSRWAESARSTPSELRRPLPLALRYRSTGSGSGDAGGGAARGEARRASTSTPGSDSWCTNDELAPFSSRRRTR
jgi:hypothetical protein